MNKLSPRLLALIAGGILLVLLISLRAADSNIISTTRGAGFDLLQRIWPRVETEAQPVRIVDIDEASLRKLGQWPWPRSQLAKLSENLLDLGAAVVVFDIVFPEPDRLSPRRVFENADVAALVQSVDPATLPDNDQTFARAIAGKPVVLAFADSGIVSADQTPVKAGFAQTGLDALGAAPLLSGITSNIPVLNAAATGLGGMNLNLAADQGIARQVPMLWSDGTRFVPSLSLEAIRVAQGAETLLVHASADQENAINSITSGDLEIPVSEAGLFYIYYRPDSLSMYVSAADVLSGNQAETLRQKVEGHVVFVGTSAVGLLDLRTSALGQTIPGVSIHAQVVEQILSGTYLTRPEWAVGAEYIVVLLLGLGATLLSSLARPMLTILATSIAASGIIAAVIAAFRSQGILLDATFPLFALAATTLLGIAMRLLVSDRDGRKLRGAFAHYVAPTVLAEIERNPQSLKLGGEIRDVTVLFMDIENFTPLSEKLEPTTLLKLVNQILDAGSRAILAERGTIDKYIGDAIMAFWNAPIAIADHQFHAAKAALGMRKAIAALNDEPAIAQLLLDNKLPKLAVRIGLASGPACVGNMGSRDRFDYSVLGETVNIAARIESSCKDLGCDIAIAGPLTDKTMSLALLHAGARSLKGRSQRADVFVVLGDTHIAAQDAFIAFRRTHDELIQFIGKKRSKAMAQSLLTELADEHPNLATYFERIPRRISDYAVR